MHLPTLIDHPEQLDRDTLYELRSTLALYPYFQTARLLLLQNLYLLHDPTFDEELRRAAIYITDRKVIFALVEAAHYRLAPSAAQTTNEQTTEGDDNRTIALIDHFLHNIPSDEPDEKKPHRKPTPADAAVDYVAYLMEMEDEQDNNDTPEMKGQSLIDHFIENDNGKITLSENPTYTPQEQDTSQNENEEEYFTETLARIYIKQERYSKALEIIKRLSLNFPKKNAYFADQIRFLEKLIINNNKKQ